MIMDNSFNFVFLVFLIAACFLGVVVSILNTSRFRNRSSNDDILNIEDAFKLKEAAILEFQNTSNQLEQVHENLNDTKSDNLKLIEYVKTLENLLDENDIEYEKLDL